MNDKQIRSTAKACLNKTDCNHCPYNDEGCVRALVSNLITLSEKQESENKRLEQEIEIYKRGEEKTLTDLVIKVKKFAADFFEWDEEDFIPNFSKYLDRLIKENTKTK